MRRRTSNILSGLLVVGFVASLVGAIAVVVTDPRVAGLVLLGGLGAGIALARAMGELRWSSTLSTGGVLGLIVTIFGLGAYALYAIAGVPKNVAIGVLAVVIALLLVNLVRAMIASGSADDPYDD